MNITILDFFKSSKSVFAFLISKFQFFQIFKSSIYDSQIKRIKMFKILGRKLIQTIKPELIYNLFKIIKTNQIVKCLILIQLNFIAI